MKVMTSSLLLLVLAEIPLVYAEVKSQTNETITQCCPTCQTPQAIQCRTTQAQHRSKYEAPVIKTNKAGEAGNAAQ